jgi:lysophospholipase L1-like esterase
LATQVPAIDAEADLITITVGGNDIDWVGILQACAVSAPACQNAIGAASVTLATTLPSELDALFTAISSQAPGAKVVVLGYPHLFTPDPSDPTTYPVYAAVNAATDQLNAVINAETVEADGLGGADFQYVDVTERFAGHGANTTDPWINPFPALSPAAVPLHPNAEGQQAYYAAVRSTGNLKN